jgi:hypothetical protein
MSESNEEHVMPVCMASYMTCRNLSLEFATKARGCKVANQEKDPGFTFHAPRSAKSVKE